MLFQKWKTLLKSGKLTGILIGAAALLVLCIVLLPERNTSEPNTPEPA